MRYSKYYILVASITYLALTIACSKTLQKYKYYEYSSKGAFPKMVYMENEVNPVTTNVIPEEREIYIEVTKRDGKKESGKLISISQEDLIFSTGYYYSTVNDSTVRIDNRIVIPKENILVLSIW